MMERAKVQRSTWEPSWRRLRAVALALVFLTALGVAARADEGARIDLNSASAAELESLPGVGPAKAQAIIAHREAAPFKSTEELVDVKGIGEKLFAQLKDRVTVASPTASGARARAHGEGAEAKGGRSASATAGH
jgi:competence ComEA-like helix-hairpin-helix protein